ncbi:hypothetical protein NMY22_g778 [Coprinellus aureogranulatus]|nr:hypothetical protein NMY22_g778 [Coprinellus aureogranulatus]
MWTSPKDHYRRDIRETVIFIGSPPVEVGSGLGTTYILTYNGHVGARIDHPPSYFAPRQCTPHSRLDIPRPKIRPTAPESFTFTYRHRECVPTPLLRAKWTSRFRCRTAFLLLQIKANVLSSALDRTSTAGIPLHSHCDQALGVYPNTPPALGKAVLQSLSLSVPKVKAGNVVRTSQRREGYTPVSLSALTDRITAA